MPDGRTIALYDARAQDYAKMAKAEPDADLLAFIDLLPPQASVLDYGCGPGSSAVLLQKAGFTVDAFDAAPGMVTLAKSRGINARLATFDDPLPQSYDGIWANFSLLHAPRETLPDHIKSIAAALNPGGIFHCGMKTGTGASRDSIDRLYTFVSIDELHTLLEKAGLTIVTSRTGLDKGFSGTEDPFVITLARKT